MDREEKQMQRTGGDSRMRQKRNRKESGKNETKEYGEEDGGGICW